MSVEKVFFDAPSIRNVRLDRLPCAEGASSRVRVSIPAALVDTGYEERLLHYLDAAETIGQSLPNEVRLPLSRRQTRSGVDTSGSFLLPKQIEEKRSWRIMGDLSSEAEAGSAVVKLTLPEVDEKARHRNTVREEASEEAEMASFEADCVISALPAPVLAAVLDNADVAATVGTDNGRHRWSDVDTPNARRSVADLLRSIPHLPARVATALYPTDLSKTVRTSGYYTSEGAITAATFHSRLFPPRRPSDVTVEKGTQNDPGVKGDVVNFYLSGASVVGSSTKEEVARESFSVFGVPPDEVSVSPEYRHALPVYEVGHHAKMEKIKNHIALAQQHDHLEENSETGQEELLGGLGFDLRLVGRSYSGVRVGDEIVAARELVDELVAEYGGRRSAASQRSAKGDTAEGIVLV